MFQRKTGINSSPKRGRTFFVCRGLAPSLGKTEKKGGRDRSGYPFESDREEKKES